MRKKSSITIADIARKAGVSRTTVSFYLNKKFEKMSDRTREKIRDVIEETDFKPNALARSLNDKQSFLVGVMVQRQDPKEKTDFIQGVQDYLQEHNYQIIVASTSSDLDDERQTAEKMINVRVDGLIVNPSPNFDLLWNTMKASLPLVAWNPLHSSRYSRWIRSNDYEAVYSTLEKEAFCGYTRFVMVTEENGSCPGIEQRTLAFDHLVQNLHLQGKTVYVTDLNDRKELEYLLMKEIQIDEKTCFFVTTPALLEKVYLIFRRYHELMPDRIGLLGFDSLEWADMVSPSVTTIVQPFYEEGKQAGRLILDAILENDRQLPTQIFQCSLHEGETTLKIKEPDFIPETETSEENSPAVSDAKLQNA